MSADEEDTRSKRRHKRQRDEGGPEISDDASAMEGIIEYTEALGERVTPPVAPSTVVDPSQKQEQDRVKKDAAPNLNFPIPGSSGVPCVVKLYTEDENAFKVSDIVEIEGILSHRYQINVAERFA